MTGPQTPGGAGPAQPRGGWERDLTQDELFDLANQAGSDDEDVGPGAGSEPGGSDHPGAPDVGAPEYAGAPEVSAVTDGPADADVANLDDPTDDFVPGGYRPAAWWFLRLSALLLVVLVLGNLLTLHVLDGGVHRLNWGVLAARWSSPWWRLWDLAVIWLGMLHGGLGLRTVINDYAGRPAPRQALTVALALLIVGVAGTATVVALTFSPDI